MSSIKRPNKTNVIQGLILGSLFGLLFVFIYDLNRLYPLFADDWDYSFMYYGTERIQNVFEVFHSQMKHYTMWGGRLVVHGILQELLLFGVGWSDLLNSLVFVIYIFVIYKIANSDNRINFSIPIWILIFVWFFQPNFANTILWLTGSVNYLWGTCIILLFIYPYYLTFRKTLNNNTNILKSNYLLNIVFFFFGVIAGWTNENMAVAMLVIVCAFTYLIWRYTKKVRGWCISGITGAVVGMALMISAPGNYIRFKKELKDMGLDNLPKFDLYITRISNFFESFYHYILILFIIYIIVLILFNKYCNKENKNQFLLASSIFLVGALIGGFALLAAPVFPPRTWFGVVTLLIIAIMILIANLDYSSILMKWLNWGGLILAAVFFLITYSEGRKELVKFNTFITDREKQILQQKAQGESDIVLHGGFFDIDQDKIIPKISDFTSDTNTWIYKAYTRYYDVESIVIKE